MKHIFIIIILSIAQISIAAESTSIKPFTTDGCSLFPDGTLLQDNTLWQNCCIEHDKAYWRGGSYQEREDADHTLAECVANLGHPKIAALMLEGVRVGGSPYWLTTFRWGYGWPYFRDYKTLTPEELATVETMSYSLNPFFYQRHRHPESKNTGIITPALKLIQDFKHYQIALFTLDTGQEYCEIVDVYQEKQNLVIQFNYQGKTKLILSEFEQQNAFAAGTYPITLPMIGPTLVEVQLKFNPDGTAHGYWANLGWVEKFNIIKKLISENHEHQSHQRSIGF